METHCWQQSNPYPIRGRTGWRFCPLLADLLPVCFPSQRPNHTTPPAASHPPDKLGSCGTCRVPGCPCSSAVPPLLCLFLSAAGCGDQEAFVLVNQSPGCRVSCGEGVLVLLAGNVGLAGSSPAHAAGPHGVGACWLSLPFAALTSPIPHQLPRTEMSVFGGSCARDLGLKDVAGKSGGGRS